MTAISPPLCTLLLSGIAFLLTPGMSASQTVGTCEKVLVQRTQLNTLSRRAQLAWLKLIDETNYEQSKSEGTAIFPGYFAGDFDQFKESRKSLFQNESYNSSYSEASSQLNIEVPEAAVTEWGHCVQAFSHGLFGYAKEVDDDKAVVTLSWSPSPGLGSLHITDVDFDGSIKPGSKIEKLSGQNLAPGDYDYIVKRASPGQSIVGIIAASTGNACQTAGAYTLQIRIPSKPKPLPPSCAQMDAAGICEKCEGNFSIEGLGTNNPLVFSCKMKAGKSYTFTAKGTIQTDLGQGPAIVIAIQGPDGHQTATENLNNPNNIAFAFALSQPGVSSQDDVTGVLKLTQCVSNNPGGTGCSIRKAHWKMCASGVDCSWQ